MATFQHGWPVSFPIAVIISVISARPWGLRDRCGSCGGDAAAHLCSVLVGRVLHPAPTPGCTQHPAAINGVMPQTIGGNKYSYWKKDWKIKAEMCGCVCVCVRARSFLLKNWEMLTSPIWKKGKIFTWKQTEIRRLNLIQNAFKLEVQTDGIFPL